MFTIGPDRSAITNKVGQPLCKPQSTYYVMKYETADENLVCCVILITVLNDQNRYDLSQRFGGSLLTNASDFDHFAGEVRASKLVADVSAETSCEYMRGTGCVVHSCSFAHQRVTKSGAKESTLSDRGKNCVRNQTQKAKRLFRDKKPILKGSHSSRDCVFVLVHLISSVLCRTVAVCCCFESGSCCCHTHKRERSLFLCCESMNELASRVLLRARDGH